MRTEYKMLSAVFVCLLSEFRLLNFVSCVRRVLASVAYELCACVYVCVYVLWHCERRFVFYSVYRLWVCVHTLIERHTAASPSPSKIKKTCAIFCFVRKALVKYHFQSLPRNIWRPDFWKSVCVNEKYFVLSITYVLLVLYVKSNKSVTTNSQRRKKSKKMTWGFGM